VRRAVELDPAQPRADRRPHGPDRRVSQAILTSIFAEAQGFASAPSTTPPISPPVARSCRAAPRLGRSSEGTGAANAASGPGAAGAGDASPARAAM